MTDRVTAPYGAWPSPIAASDVARGERRLGFPSVVGEEIWWEESRPDEGGRTTVVHRDADGAVTELLGASWDVRTRVHEYGGRSYLPVPPREGGDGHGIVFANRADQRLYLLERGADTPVPISPEPGVAGGLRYADPAISPDGERVICVQERHPAAGGGESPSTGGGEDSGSGEGGNGRGGEDRPVRSIVALPLSGSAADDPGAVTELVSGADFYASPAPSPDGAHLAWICWNHPRMPWDGTELRVGALEGGAVTGAYTLKGGVAESVLSPVWLDGHTVTFLSDWSGWWNLYEIGLTGQAIALYPAEEEFTHGFSLGLRPYVRLDDGRLVALHGHTDLVPGVCDPATAEFTPLETGLESWQTLAGDGAGTVVGLAAGTHAPQSLVRLDPDSGSVEVLRRSREEVPDEGYLPTPRTAEFSGRYGGTVHATVYPPANPAAQGEGPAPYAVWVHGGPIAKAVGSLDLVKAYFTSRGIGIVDVNYGGSIGFGRSYRERLHGQWGVLDVEDATAAARALVDEGSADPERLAVRGGSAGGLTTLLALGGDTFACGTSSWGVTDLLRLAAETHDFESRYLDGLVGPLPGYAATYRERSPINRADDLSVPVLILQGTADPVVPPAQARALAASLAERGIRHALVEFAGEGHGLRGADNQQRALEAELAFYGEVFGFDPPDVPTIELVTGSANGQTAGGPAEAEEADSDLVAEPLPPLEERDGTAADHADEQARRA